MKFRKKPIVIEAFELGENPMPGWFLDAVKRGDVVVPRDGLDGGGVEIHTLEGTHWANAQTPERQGDWIIKGVKGELYPCNPDIFRATYEPVEDDRGGAHQSATEAMQADVADLLAACGLGVHARDASPHQVVQHEILPRIREMSEQCHWVPDDEGSES